jgi:hypothetical protein
MVHTLAEVEHLLVSSIGRDHEGNARAEVLDKLGNSLHD